MKSFIVFSAGIISMLVFVFGCSNETPKLVPLKDKTTEIVRDTGGNKVSFNRSIDILFVVDDSASMSDHQANLALNVKKFTQGIVGNQILDYHIGVVTSNMDNPPATAKPGYGWKGELNGVTKFISRSTAMGSEVLEANLQPGTEGSGIEQFFGPVVAALSPPMLSGANAGFYRPDAYLAVIFLTDSDDQSTFTASDFYKFLLSLKNGDPTKIISYGVNIPSTDQKCGRSSEPLPVKLEAFYALAKTQTLGLCDLDYGIKLAELGADLVRRVGRVLYLSRPAARDTIAVTYGSQLVPMDERTGWSFDPTRNAILFGEDLDLKPEPPGTKIEVYFQTAEFQR